MRSPAPHSIHAPAASTPRPSDPPPEQSAPPSSPASPPAASARLPLASPAPASKVAPEGAARAPSRAVRGFFLLRVSFAHSACPERSRRTSQRYLSLRILLCASSAFSASLRYLFLSLFLLLPYQ